MRETTWTMLIGGTASEGGGEPLPSENPSTEQHLADIPHATEADVRQAVDAAVAGGAEWSAQPWQRRAACVEEMAERVAAAADELGELDATDAGIPVRTMRREVRESVRRMHYFAALASEVKGVSFPPDPARQAYTVREPYGTVARIIPFNHPLKFACAKIAAPLVAGNAVILKPAEHTSLSALRLGQLVADVFPPGVLNVVTGLGATTGAALVEDPRVRRIAFTGGVENGRRVLRSAADSIKSVSLELGGKNPMIVFPDADVEAAAHAAVEGMGLRGSQGQSCQSNSRLLVHSSIKDRFVDCLAPLLEAIVVGDALDEKTEMGPLAYRGHYERVLDYVARGTADGARLVTGGNRPDGLPAGFFLEPTLFDGVTADMPIATEEIFGPVLALLEWSEPDEALALANDVEFGLTANIWTSRLTTAHTMAARLNAGYVWVNGRGGRTFGAPFGGYKNSGLGRENSLDELLGYTQIKTVDIDLGG